MNIKSILDIIRKDSKCTGCKFLYSEGLGYSNDQRTGTRLSCAVNRQANLPIELLLTDSVQATQAGLSGCDRFAPGVQVSLDVTGHDGASLYCSDPEQIEAITVHSGRPRQGRPQSWALANLIRAKPGD